MVLLAFCTTLKERGVYSNCHKLNKTVMLSDKISIEFVNSKTSSPSIYMSRLSRDSYRSSKLNLHVKIFSVLVEFVIGSLCCSRRFFSEYSKFTSPQKPTFQIPVCYEKCPQLGRDTYRLTGLSVLENNIK